MKHDWDATTVIYTHFKSTLRQETKERELLPTKQESIKDIVLEIIPEYGLYSDLRKGQEKYKAKYHYEYTFEPKAEIIFRSSCRTVDPHCYASYFARIKCI